MINIYSVVNKMLTPAWPHLLYICFKVVKFEKTGFATFTVDLTPSLDKKIALHLHPCKSKISSSTCYMHVLFGESNLGSPCLDDGDTTAPPKLGIEMDLRLAGRFAIVTV